MNTIETSLPSNIEASRRFFYAVKLFERDDKIEAAIKSKADADVIEAVEKSMDDDSESIITDARYTYITSVIKDCYKKGSKEVLTTSDKIDRIVTNRVLALPIFALVMWFVYYISVTTVGTIVTDWTNDVLFGEIIPPAVDSFLDFNSMCRLVTWIDCGWYYWWCRSCYWLCTTDVSIILLLSYLGRLWIYGTCCLYHGPYFP